ncbi:TPA: 50S ribosomal protein L27 [Candidatus Berkelbacteria bacterium]|uniref:Large ribosomal subunit protein bL27 n=1 Tax=Berkelbacteria bacterium GW2011_GWE1_39_12 TaxID=1618337 RepID=A0A0G4B3V4_9BACT|nr:MAG: 50S ribosomal protein L27, large subunit ribosomal protein L27 [Berkelbacteria bacterium GW2011_GWE1_39_12]HBO60693.1 50S ribosomal protein L27 [Candidatus Berkelbacteria bacterium]
MAHTKAKGTSKLGRDSQAKRLGVKIFGGAKTLAGQILIRQRGSKFYAGENVGQGEDDTLYAKKAGTVSFEKKAVKRFSGMKIQKSFISVK